MKLDLKSSKAIVAAMLVIAAAGVAFWVLALSPKREEAKRLGAEVARLEGTLARHRAAIAQGEAARREFPADYQRLVVLGKAVPGDDDTASLLVQLTRIAKRNKVRFQDIELTAEGGEGEAPAAGEGPAAATEAAASLLPLGATVGSAGLAVMPYTLTFRGDFFEIADFIAAVDGLVDTHRRGVRASGRLITIDGFSLAPDPVRGFPALKASFSVTTYVTPPEPGGGGAAPPAGPDSADAVPAAARTGGGR